jgi:hypothetical protein
VYQTKTSIEDEMLFEENFEKICSKVDSIYRLSNSEMTDEFKLLIKEQLELLLDPRSNVTMTLRMKSLSQ